jgi:hypothetical protein
MKLCLRETTASTAVLLVLALIAAFAGNLFLCAEITVLAVGATTPTMNRIISPLGPNGERKPHRLCSVRATRKPVVKLRSPDVSQKRIAEPRIVAALR